MCLLFHKWPYMLRVLRKKVGTVYCRNNVTVPVCLIIEIPKVLLEKKLQKTTKSTKKLYSTILNS